MSHGEQRRVTNRRGINPSGCGFTANSHLADKEAFVLVGIRKRILLALLGAAASGRVATVPNGRVA
jgi:hypothetical protein